MIVQSSTCVVVSTSSSSISFPVILFPKRFPLSSARSVLSLNRIPLVCVRVLVVSKSELRCCVYLFYCLHNLFIYSTTVWMSRSLFSVSVPKMRVGFFCVAVLLSRCLTMSYGLASLELRYRLYVYARLNCLKSTSTIVYQIHRFYCLLPQATSVTVLLRALHRITVVSCRVVSCRVVSCRVVSCRVVSCRVASLTGEFHYFPDLS